MEEEDRKRAAVLRMFLDFYADVHKPFENDEERLAIQWFNGAFKWCEVYKGDAQVAANDMVAAYMGITQSNVDAEAQKQAEFGSARVAAKRPKQERTPEKPKKQEAKKQKQAEAGASAAGSSSSVEPSDRAMSALVTFLHSFVELSAEEQRVFIEKLARE